MHRFDYPPAAPINLVAANELGQVALDWDDNTEPDLAGYRVYRQQWVDDDFFDISELIGASDYIDTTADPALTYTYKVHADDTAGQLSNSSYIGGQPL